MEVKFTDLFKLAPDKSKIFSKIGKLIRNNQFIGGEEVLKFEEEFSKFTKSKYCVTLGNGTDALELAIKSLGLRKGSEVIIPANTWVSTAEAALNCNLKIIFCDVNLDDYTICLKDLKRKITSKTGLIMPVHLYGNPCDVVTIKKIIGKKNIKIIEDCAQAHGSTFRKKHVGTFGDIGTFSFFPGKNLGCFGDGGGIITNNKKIYDFIMRARNHGALKKYDHKFSGYNSRLDTIQASVLRIKLKKYKSVITKRNKLANIYKKNLSKIKSIQLFKLRPSQLSCFHQYVIRTNKRNQLMKYLKNHGVHTMIHYPYMLNQLSFFKYKKKLNRSKNLGNKILSLPISEEHSSNEIRYICNKIFAFFNNQ